MSDLGLRSASPPVRKVLAIVAMDHLLEDGAEPPTIDLRTDGGIGAVADEAAVLGAMARIAGLTRRVIKPSRSVSVTLTGEAGLMTAASTDAVARALDAAQYREGAGPSVEATCLGIVAGSDALEDELRWHELRRAADAMAIASVVSSAIVIDGEPIGSLNVYGRAAFAASDRARAERMAADAARLLRPPTHQP